MKEQLDAFLADYAEKELFSGVVRITKNDTVLYEQYCGFANREDGTLFHKDSVFTLYSITKAFNAIGLMLLKDKGLVDLDAHPSAYVPEVKACHKDLTVRHLLHHVSGLPDFLQTPSFREQHAPGTPDKTRQHLQIISQYPMLFAPGECAQYCNINFTICALIIENISGLSYPEYMAKEVFGPMGANTAYICHDPRPTGSVQGYALVDGAVVPVDRGSDWMFGGGDVMGTVDDVYCLNKVIKHKLMLSEESWQEVLSPHSLNNKGMGCTVTNWHGKKRITHNGGHRGFRTLHIQLPEDDFDIILLSNCGWGTARKDVSEKIHALFYGNNNAPTQEVEMDKGYI